MKLVTLNRGPKGSAGVFLSDGAILDLAMISVSDELKKEELVAVAADMVSILTNDQLGKVRDILAWVEQNLNGLQNTLRSNGVILDESDATFLAAIPNPSFILAQGLAYHEHLDEMGVPVPKNPMMLVKAPSSVTGHNCPIILPSDHPDMVDWEGEFSIVIGKGCHNITEAEVMDHIAGYTIINDVSARDWTPAALNQDQTQMQAAMTWNDNVAGKQFPTFTPIGPVMVTKDEISDPHDLQLQTRVNGVVVQDTNTADLIFSVTRLISHCSKWYKFLPGDIVTTGSPAGVGYGRDPQVFLKEGDLVEVSVSGIGTLSNRVINA